MKKKLFTLIALLLAGVIAYGGSGVNIYFFCCNDCRSEGVNAVIDHKCCEIHEHHHLGGFITHIDEHKCDEHIAVNHDACGINRIFFDWQSVTKNQLQLQPHFLYLGDFIFLSTPNADLGISENLVEPPLINRRTQKPPDLSKDDYFSLLTTLII
ncbi:MAG: hypothetical protein Q4G63_07495 [Bacteroidia bacterium]|nr:hypothetical protein [Bacteroidia bacterium]